jgi:hypothetical protein
MSLSQQHPWLHALLLWPLSETDKPARQNYGVCPTNDISRKFLC